MLQNATWLHLRIPFSFYLLPVFVFACATVKPDGVLLTGIIFLILHLFLYPASNGFNSYFDKDEESIGGLERPPKVSEELYWTSLIFDAVALVAGFMINWAFALMLFGYGLASKAYSHPLTRWKKKPLLGWLVAGFFQGYFTFMLVVVGLKDFSPELFLNAKYFVPAFLSSALLWGSYPMTQVYQHEEDGRRGDETLSRKLGVLGTFHFTAVCFTLASGGFFYYFLTSYEMTTALAFLIAMGPVLAYFLWWYAGVRNDRKQANFRNTMRLNFYSAVCLNLFFSWLWLFT
ncbi:MULTISPECIES: UbiA family prenyltransferase [unclassified Imperialibacter]|uniref:UbiA family prenyltransferase n=1 Tax=unclassified Imperialibacter TaxID=2629706 RepID=UPI00125BF915|nr:MULTISPECIES: UbiA family prenyltransferase [unclassified Imperialibacter]CAD5269846.1 1,4-dihydroxy-2-naphthoate octaprenyltransferase [Imperialibacter sp. 89]CAD5297850.1 1,4-dihydroxy-2-naphthoate octaprenyltransferase [Imperialibacter sp. 75]VVT34218.1 1,4-dihydroxy-2-naphthoate octaprenyltransferase [Imperialibacter sp. EC-SDR9]